MRTPLVAGNWKMNGTTESVVPLAEAVARDLDDAGGVECAVCPPFVYLGLVAPVLAGTGVRLGAQDVSDRPPGALTGETAAGMLRDVGCDLVIVGHSERRHLLGESDEVVAAKLAAAMDAGLVPILCVGEQLEEREAGLTDDCVARQLKPVLATGRDLAGVVIAYEPVWAIGTGRTATPEQAEAVHAFIRERVAAANERAAGEVRILYGGSVKPANAKELFSMPNIDGGLIGGASLDAGDFLAICEAAR